MKRLNRKIILFSAITLIIAAVFIVGKNNLFKPLVKGSAIENSDERELEDNLITNVEEDFFDNKILSFDDLKIKLDSHHIISIKQNGESTVYRVKVDEDSILTSAEYDVEVNEIHKPEIENIEDMIIFAEDFFDDYDSLDIFYKDVGKSGIKSICKASKFYDSYQNEDVHYLICYTDKAYEIKNASMFLINIKNYFQYPPSYSHTYLTHRELYYETTAWTTIESTYFYYDNRAEILITRPNTNETHKMEIIAVADKNYRFPFEVKNSEGDVLISGTVPWYSLYNEFVFVSDLNGDGYGDLEIMSLDGASNNHYIGYVYNPKTNDYTCIGELEI